MLVTRSMQSCLAMKKSDWTISHMYIHFIKNMEAPDGTNSVWSLRR